MARSSVTIDSGELPTAEGVAEGNSLFHVITRWQYAANNFRNDCRFLKQMIEETDRLRLWEKNVGGFTYKDRDDFLRNKILINYDLTEQDMVEIVAALKRDDTESVRATLTKKQKAMAETMKGAVALKKDEELKTARAEGGKKGGRGNLGSQTTKVNRGSPYLAARIKRDRPDIAAAVERGEYESMRAAAIDAGIIKPPSLFAQLKKLIAKSLPALSDDEREELRQMLD